jgi:hypothetical protein
VICFLIAKLFFNHTHSIFNHTDRMGVIEEKLEKVDKILEDNLGNFEKGGVTFEMMVRSELRRTRGDDFARAFAVNALPGLARIKMLLELEGLKCSKRLFVPKLKKSELKLERFWSILVFAKLMREIDSVKERIRQKFQIDGSVNFILVSRDRRNKS